MTKQDRRNQYFFGLGTVGRDMFYSFEANTILYFLTNVLSLPMWVFAVTSTLLSVLRASLLILSLLSVRFLAGAVWVEGLR